MKTKKKLFRKGKLVPLEKEIFQDSEARKVMEILVAAKNSTLTFTIYISSYG